MPCMILLKILSRKKLKNFNFLKKACAEYHIRAILKAFKRTSFLLGDRNTRLKRCTNPSCNRRGQFLSFDDFPRKKESKDGRYSWCKECSINYEREKRHKILASYEKASGGKWWLFQYFLYHRRTL